jgi:energy-coupling factor transporter ATP-binding protein EcfA2
MADAIIVQNLSFTYLHENKEVLKNINIVVPKDKVTALVGPVGAGKTTLLLTMNRLIPEYIPGMMSGEILINGVDISKHETEELSERINMLFDDPVLQIVGLTVEEDVAFGPANLGLPREEIWERVHRSLAQMRLQGYEKRNPRQLSGGEMQLLAMAGVFAMHPEVLVMDEPVAMLDPVGKKMVFDAIKEINRNRGLTTLVSDSGADIEAICEFADHMILMNGGEIVAQGEPSELLAQRDLVEATTLRVPQVTELFWDIRPSEDFVPVRLQQAVDKLQGDNSLRTKKKNSGLERNHRKRRPGDILISARNVQYTYLSTPPVDALKGIDLDIKKGELVALLGQNGSGKTTLALNLVGILRPTNEDAIIEVTGKNIKEIPLKETIQLINYVFQNPYNQLFCQTFGEEVEYGPKQLELPPEIIEQRVISALEDVGLLELRKFYQASLTRSEATLLGLASVLSMNPLVIIADEPTKGLDEPTGRKVLKVLQKRCDSGGAVLMITHDMELAARYATRIVVMSQGEILIDDVPQRVFSNMAVLQQAFIAPPQITRLAIELGMDTDEVLPLTPKEFSAAYL